MSADAAGMFYNEFYLYSSKQWEMAPAGVMEHTLASGVMQNAPVVVTASGLETTVPADPWAQTSGLGKYDKVGWGYFSLLGNGQPNTSKREFALHPDASGKLLFNTPLTENVYIEYESGTSSYYILNTIDLNPIRNEIDSGFIHFSAGQEPKSIYLSSTRSTLVPDGEHSTSVVATLYDANNDVIGGASVIFTIPDDFIGRLTPYHGTTLAVGPSGAFPIKVREITNNKGQARVKYTPIKTQSGTQYIVGYYEQNDAVSNFIAITQPGYALSNPFTLDVSLLDGRDYLT